MGTHRSTTTTQQVGLRITEMCWEASKVTQNDVGEDQHTLGTGGKSCTLIKIATTTKNVAMLLIVRARNGSATHRVRKKKEERKVSATNLTRKKVSTPHFRCQKKCAADQLRQVRGSAKQKLPVPAFQNKGHVTQMMLWQPGPDYPTRGPRGTNDLWLNVDISGCSRFITKTNNLTLYNTV